MLGGGGIAPPFLTSAVDGGELSPCSFSALPPGKELKDIEYDNVLPDQICHIQYFGKGGGMEQWWKDGL